jgi:hypothetical protein
MKRTLWILFFLVVTGCGVACLHYVNGADIEHHRAWARTYDLPEPSDGIFWLGTAVTLVGAFAAGLVAGRRGASHS